MKTAKTLGLLIILLTMTPGRAWSQWNMVRFDSSNFFIDNYTITPNSMVVTGFDQNFSGSFFMRTNNGGTSWDSIPLNSSGMTYQLNTIYFSDLDNGFIGGLLNNNQVLIKTSDNGNTWTNISPNPTSLYALNAISFIDPLTGYVSDPTTIYKTVDGGLNWTSGNPGFGIQDISFLNANLGYAGGDDNPMGVVMKTTDGGQTWNAMLTATTPIFSNSIGNIDVVNQDVVYASMQYTSILYRTIDGGLTWDTIQTPALYEIQDFDFINPTEGHLLSTMGEIYGTTDGGINWVLEYAVAGGFYGPSIYLNTISFSGTTGYVCGSDGLIKKYTIDPSGINDPSQENTLVVYPNPASGNEMLHIIGVDGDYKLELFNQTGQLVANETGYNKKSEELSYQLPNLPHGLYLLVVTSGNRKLLNKLVAE